MSASTIQENFGNFEQKLFIFTLDFDTLKRYCRHTGPQGGQADDDPPPYCAMKPSVILKQKNPRIFKVTQLKFTIRATEIVVRYWPLYIVLSDR